MYEEYLNSKEIVQKIADLKIRLALQQEFEQEVDKLVAEVNPTDTGQTRQIREMEEQVLRDIAAHTVRRTQRHEQKRRFPRCARVIAAIALLIMVSVGSAMATVHMVQIGLLKLDIQTYPERTSYGLVPSDAAMDVPAEWQGDFYPASACQRSPIAMKQWGFKHEKNKEQKKGCHLWMASFFRFIAANLSLTHAVTAVSPR